MPEMSKCKLIPNCKVISAKYKYLVNADARPVKNAIQPTSFRNSIDSVSVYWVGIGAGLYFLHQRHEDELDKLEQDTAKFCLDWAAEHYERTS